MISKQKARRIAYGIIWKIAANDTELRVPPEYHDDEGARAMIRDELIHVVDELKKKSQ